MINTFTRVIKNFITKEWFLFLVFTLTHLVDRGDTYYLVITVLFFIALYSISKSLIKAAWICFLSLFLLFRVRFIISPIYISEFFKNIYGYMQLNEVFFIAFFDGMLVLLIYLLKRRGGSKYNIPMRFHYIDFALFSFLILGIASSFFSPFPSTSWFYLFRFTLGVLTYYLVRILFVNKSLVDPTFRILFIFAIFQSSLTIMQWFNQGPLGLSVENFFTSYGRYADELPSLYRPGGIYWDSNLSASILLIILPLITYLLIQSRKKKSLQIFNLLGEWLVIIAIILTGSRVAWIILSLFVYIFIKYSSYWKKTFLLFKKEKRLVYFISIITLTLIPQVVIRLLTFSQIFSDSGGFSYRLAQARVSLSIAINNLLGIGVNALQYEKLLSGTPSREQLLASFAPGHNIFIQALSSAGFLGMIIMILLVSSLMITIRNEIVNKNNLLGFMLSFSMLGYLLTAQAYPWLYSTQITQLFFIILGIYYAQIQKISKKN